MSNKRYHATKLFVSALVAELPKTTQRKAASFPEVAKALALQADLICEGKTYREAVTDMKAELSNGGFDV